MDNQYKKRYIKLSCITIQNAYKLVMPKSSKFMRKYNQLCEQIALNNGELPEHPLTTPIIIDKHKNLIDGYITYLLMKMVGYKRAHVLMLTSNHKLVKQKEKRKKEK